MTSPGDRPHGPAVLAWHGLCALGMAAMVLPAPPWVPRAAFVLFIAGVLWCGVRARRGGDRAHTSAWLLVYASLVRSRLGRLPDDVVVLDNTGSEQVIAVDASAVDAVVSLSAAAVDGFNQSLASASGAEARPSPQTCRWCEFRVVCGDYWAAREKDWPTSNDIAGVVVGITTTYVELRSIDGSGDRRLVLTGTEQPEMGDVVLAVDLDPAGFQTSRARWNSRLRVLPATEE